MLQHTPNESALHRGRTSADLVAACTNHALIVRTETRLARSLAFLQHLEDSASTVESSSVIERVRIESRVRNNVQRMREIISGLAGDLAILSARVKKTDDGKRPVANLQHVAQRRPPQNDFIMRSRLCSEV